MSDQALVLAIVADRERARWILVFGRTRPEAPLPPSKTVVRLTTPRRLLFDRQQIKLEATPPRPALEAALYSPCRGQSLRKGSARVRSGGRPHRDPSTVMQAKQAAIQKPRPLNAFSRSWLGSHADSADFQCRPLRATLFRDQLAHLSGSARLRPARPFAIERTDNEEVVLPTTLRRDDWTAYSSRLKVG